MTATKSNFTGGLVLSPDTTPTIPATIDATALIEKAIEAGTPVETMEKLLAMRAQLRDEQAKAAFYDALTGFQSEAVVIKKTKQAGSGSYSYKYAPLEEIIKAIREPLRRHGLSYRFDSELVGDPRPAQRVTCIVTHVLGHSESNTFEAPIDTGAKMNSMQKAASAVTYARRYALCDALGVVTGETDDDARSIDPAASAGAGAAPRLGQPAGYSERKGDRSTVVDVPPNAGGGGQPAAPATPTTAPRVLKLGELKSLWVAVRKSDRGEDEFRTFLGTLGVESTKEITIDQIEPITAWLAGEV